MVFEIWHAGAVVWFTLGLPSEEVSERLKEHAWKACVGETQPWVRIPPSPPSSLPNWLLRRIERKNARILAEIRVVLRGTGLRRIGLFRHQTQLGPVFSGMCSRGPVSKHAWGPAQIHVFVGSENHGFPVR